jgi:predicted transcriptional regulator
MDPTENPSRRTRRPRGALQDEVLAVLQRAPRALTPAEVGARVGGGLSYSAVATVLSRLQAKGLLDRAVRGRAYAYAPVADAPGLVARRMWQLLDAGPERESVLMRFVGMLPAGDEALLRRLLLAGERGAGARGGADPGSGDAGEGEG